jgi:predicted enzyme related to lactoylglutathione lyase
MSHEFGLLEHINMTVSDPDRTAAMLEKLFGWHVRWSGPSLGGGRTVHVGDEERYVALYSPAGATDAHPDNYRQKGAVNHLGVLVEDLAPPSSGFSPSGSRPTATRPMSPAAASISTITTRSNMRW